MDINRETVNEWLERNRRSREWLAEKCDTSLSNIGMWLNKKGTPREIPGDHKITIHRLMQEDAAKESAKPLQNLILEFTDAQYGPIEQAALAKRQTVREWSKDMLNGAATLDVEDFVKRFFPEHAKRPQSVETSRVISFPEVSLLRAAAGFPILADAEMVEPDRELGAGRFLLELRGDSMEPRFKDRQRVVMRDKATLKRPMLKYGECYCFIHDGQAAFKQWAKNDQGDKVLRSLNPEHADIIATEDTDWIGWFDPNDNA